MKIYKSQKEFKAEIKNNRFYSDESIDITAFNLDVKAKIEIAGNIKAGNIKAGDIKAKEVEYYAIAFAYKNINVKSIKGIRKNSRHFVLDGNLEINN